MLYNVASQNQSGKTFRLKTKICPTRETQVVEEKIKILNKSSFTVNCYDDKTFKVCSHALADGKPYRFDFPNPCLTGYFKHDREEKKETRETRVVGEKIKILNKSLPAGKGRFVYC